MQRTVEYSKILKEDTPFLFFFFVGKFRHIVPIDFNRLSDNIDSSTTQGKNLKATPMTVENICYIIKNRDIGGECRGRSD